MSNPTKYEKFEEENSSQSVDYANKVIDLETAAKSDEKADNSTLEEAAKKHITNAIKAQAVKQTSTMLSSAKQQISEGILNKFNTKIEFIKKYFDVDLEDIKMKLKSSIVPLNKDFQPLAEKRPDLYGPFWIYATLVFIVAVAGNLSGFLNVIVFNNIVERSYKVQIQLRFCAFFSRIRMNKYKVDIWIRFRIAYCFRYDNEIHGFCNPPSTGILEFKTGNLLLRLFLHSYGANADPLCGSSKLYAIGSSTVFVIFNLWKELIKLTQKSRYILIAAIAVSQLILLFALKYHFFAVIS